MIYVAITWDYELFFNKTYVSDNEILIEPTRHILRALEAKHVPATFFVDVCMMQRFESLRNESILPLIEEQVQTIAASGHEVGMHMHPGWLSAEQRGGKWCFDIFHYKLDSYSDVEIENALDYGAKKLNSLLDQSGSTCRSFRAGGYCYGPIELLSDQLKKHGFSIDSSVFRYADNQSANQSFDYRHVPDRPYWVFQTDNRIACETGSGLLELPITAVRRTPYYWYLGHSEGLVRTEKRGESSKQIVKNNLQNKFKKMRDRFYGATSLSMDSNSWKYLERIINRYQIKDHDGNQFIIAIGHPKFQEQSTLDNMKLFIDSLNERSDVSFCTLQQMRDVIIN